MRWHAETLAETEPQLLGAPAPDSGLQKEGLKRFVDFFGDLREDRVKAHIRDVYSADVRFNDTLKSIRGVEALEHYLVDTARGVESCKVEIEEVAPTAQGVYVRWRMNILFKKFRKGEVQSSIGVTHLRFDKEGRVAYHQDYWDSGANLFEKVPVLGAGIRAVKRRL
jgi:limonene-1,2-epoxide hydrolase